MIRPPPLKFMTQKPASSIPDDSGAECQLAAILPFGQSVSALNMGAMKPMSALFPAFAAMLVLSDRLLAATPQTVEPVADGIATVHTIAGNPSPARKNSDLLIVPIPQSSPSLGTGVTAVGALFYNPNGSKEPWTTGVAVMATSNGSWAAGAGHKMAWSKDRFRLTAFGGYGDVNLRFYGIGPLAGQANKSVDINDTGIIAFADLETRVSPNFYIGPKLVFVDLKVSLRPNREVPPEVVLPVRDFESRLVQAGLAATYDSRDSSLYPRNGLYGQTSWMFGTKALGGDFTNDRLTVAGNMYRSIGVRTVLAARISACAVSKGSPFYDICLYGSSSDLRGYETGRYRDRASWATQIEIRHGFTGRFGVAAFAGVGGIAPSIGDIGSSTILPAVGAGVRWQVSKQTPINLRIDYARGKDSGALYISVGEAF